MIFGMFSKNCEGNSWMIQFNSRFQLQFCYLFQKRHILEINNELEPRLSALVDDDIEDMESSEEEGEFKVSCIQLKVVSSEYKFIKGVTVKPLDVLCFSWLS